MAAKYLKVKKDGRAIHRIFGEKQREVFARDWAPFGWEIVGEQWHGEPEGRELRGEEGRQGRQGRQEGVSLDGAAEAGDAAAESGEATQQKAPRRKKKAAEGPESVEAVSTPESGNEPF